MTSDGVPVIWHDDYAVTLSQQPHTRHISDMSLQEFKQLLPANAQACSADKPADDHNGRQHERRCDGALASSSEEGVLGRFFNSEDGKQSEVARPWQVSEEDELPTLAEVFQAGPLELPWS